MAPPFSPLKFCATKRIDPQQLGAVVSRVRQFLRPTHADSRVLVLLDSQVALGVLGKGPSSTRRINYMLLSDLDERHRSGFHVDPIQGKTRLVRPLASDLL